MSKNLSVPVPLIWVSSIMLCRELTSDGKRCADAKFNFEVVTEIPILSALDEANITQYEALGLGTTANELLLARMAAQWQLIRLSRYEGTKDLSWQFSQFMVEPDVGECMQYLFTTEFPLCLRGKEVEIFKNGRTRVIGNPFLKHVNTNPQLTKNVVLYGRGIGDLTFPMSGEQILSLALEAATHKKNDSVVPTDSACLTATGNDGTQSCANSPFENLIHVICYPRTPE